MHLQYLKARLGERLECIYKAKSVKKNIFLYGELVVMIRYGEMTCWNF